MDINYISRGGLFPYQAEGIIDNLYHFYFRARHDYCTLEIAKTSDSLIINNICNIGYRNNTILNNEEAHKIIMKLYKSLIPILKQMNK